MPITFTACTCTPVTAAGQVVADPRCPVHGVPVVQFTGAASFLRPSSDDIFNLNARTHAEGQTLLRIAKELRAFLVEAPADDPDSRSLLRDCDVLERVGNWLASTNTVTFADGISVR